MKQKENNTDYKAPDLSRYETDVEGVSMNKLETGLWWIKNKELVKKIAMLILIIVSVISWLFTFYGFGYYFFKGMNEDEQMVQQLVSTTTLSPQDLADRAVKPPILSAVNILPDNSKSDLYISLHNPNLNYRGTLSYCSMAGQTEIGCGNNFILPDDQNTL